jgi:DNA-binding IclR family transcriptional regulator
MIKVLKKAADLLELVKSQGETRFTELQSRTGMNKATLSMILKSLTELRMLERTESGAFVIGQGIVRLGPGPDTLREAAQKTARELSAKINELVTVAVLRDGKRVLLVKIDPKRTVIVQEDGGSSPAAMFNTGTGVTLMAHSGETFRREYVRDNMLNVDLTGMADLFARTVRDGFCVLPTGDGDGVVIAVPVFDRRGACAAAIGAAAPRYRADDETRRKIISELKEAAARLGESVN